MPETAAQRHAKLVFVDPEDDAVQVWWPALVATPSACRWLTG